MQNCWRDFVLMNPTLDIAAKNRSKTKEDSYKYWWSLWPLEYQIVHLAFIYTLPLVHIGVSAKEQSHKSSDFYESSWTVMGQDLGPH